MTIDNPTEAQARKMQEAIVAFQEKDAQTAQAKQQADLAIALAWFNTLGINIQAATTRTQAQINHDDIEALLETETDQFRLAVLRNKKLEANNKVMAVKKVNPNS